MLRKTVFLFALLLGSFFTSRGQATCPPNVDFELGDLSYWYFFAGRVNPGPTFSLSATPPLFSLHTLMAGTGTDKYGGFPIVDPGGGFYALKLGKDTVDLATDEANFNTDRGLYYVKIPAGATNYSLIYRYAVVMENPTTHPVSEQPGFIAVAFDSATGVLAPCAHDTFYSNSPTAGLTNSAVQSNNPAHPLPSNVVVYKSWSTVSINLSGLEGHTIAVEFTAYSCAAGGHWGYAYVDMTCGLFAINAKICDDTLATLTGPSGFESYAWYDSTSLFTLGPGSSIGSTQTITIPIPDSANTYAVVVEPFLGFGCPDTLYTRVMPSHLKTHPSNDTLICGGALIPLTMGATDSAIDMPLTYSWSPGLSLSCTTCANPFAAPATTTTYYGTVTDLAGCIKKDTIVVTADNITMTTSHVNDSCFGANNGNATVKIVTGIPPYTYSWSTTPKQSTPNAVGLITNYPVPITYTVTVTDNLGCKDSTVAPITEPARINLVIDSIKGPTTCGGDDGAIYLSGLIADTFYTFTYTVGGIPHTQSGRAGATGADTLKNIVAGVYDHITVIVTKLRHPWCPFNTVGPVVVSDPTPPPVPSIGNNGPLCLNDTLNITAGDAVTGVSYIWNGPGGYSNGSDTDHIQIPNVAFGNAGVYTVTVTKNNCSSTNTSVVIVKPIPFPYAGNNSAICAGDTLKLVSGSSNGATSFRWAGPNAYSSILENPVIPNADTLATGRYRVTVTLDGCPQTDSTDVVINPIPLAPAVTDTTYCQGDTPAPLRATGINLSWYTSPALANQSVVPPVPSTKEGGLFTWYVNQVSLSVPACTSPLSTQQVKVYTQYTPGLTISDSAICTGNQITFTASNLGDDATGINWSFGVGDSIKSVNPLLHSFDAIGTYTITVTPEHQYCPNPTLTKVVNVFPYPVIDLGPDTTICPGSQLIVLSDGINAQRKAATWLWNTGETSASITVRKPGIYYAKVTINGCPNSDTVIVANDCYLDIPNAFTPNGDGVNDYFFPRQYLAKGLTSFGMDIYNRWGQLIFTTNSLDGMGWDGKFNGVPQPEGVYVYIINATFKDGEIEHHQGNITLFR